MSTLPPTTTTITPIFHRTPYAAISPLAPANSQSTRTVLITGGSAGIGLATAKAFAQAHAATVVILGRRADVLAAAVREVEKQIPASEGAETKTRVLGRVCDMADAAAAEKMWAELAREGVQVDVLILNAAATGAGVLAKGPEPALAAFETNVVANLRMTHAFLGQGKKEGKVVLNVSSAAAHADPYVAGAYSASKAAFASLLQHLTAERPTSEVRVLSIHPGAVLTDAAVRSGYAPDSLPWDDVALPAAFLVWAATESAAFLNGRFVWANWDIEGLLALRAKVEEDYGFLKIGLQGVGSLDLKAHFEEVRKMGE